MEGARRGEARVGEETQARVGPGGRQGEFVNAGGKPGVQALTMDQRAED